MKRRILAAVRTLALVVLGGAGSTLLNAADLGGRSAEGAADTVTTLQRMAVNGGEIEYEVRGAGEPVLLIHGTGVAATFWTVMEAPALAGYKLIRMHRRGFAGSSRTPVPFSLKDHAADARALLEGLGISKAHIVGHSVGAMVSLQLALDAPALVHDLIIAEPPIFNPDAPPQAFIDLTNQYKAGDKIGAMDTFSTMSYGAEWRALASRVPGGPEQVLTDVDTVYMTEVPAMTSWVFNAETSKRITQPIIYVTGGGPHGGSWTQLAEWIPGITRHVVPNTTHAMLMQDGTAVAEVIGAFLKQHPLP